MTEQKRQLPHDLAAEQGVLGGILVHGAEVMAAVVSMLGATRYFGGFTGEKPSNHGDKAVTAPGNTLE